MILQWLMALWSGMFTELNGHKANKVNYCQERCELNDYSDSKSRHEIVLL